MLRIMMIALFASASVAMLAPDAASARGGFGGGGGGFRSMAFAPGGFRGGNFAVNNWRGGFHPGFRHRRFPIVAAGFGLGYGAYGYYDDYYGYDDSYYYGDSGCYIVRQSVLTPYGWRIRPVQVCG